MRSFFTIIFILNACLVFGQDLIFNGGFEKKANCPKTLGDFFVEGWHSTLYARKTPDFFSSCAIEEDFSSPKNFLINVAPRNGDGYIGLVGYNPHNGYREYVTTQLIEPLIKDEIYTFSLSLSQPELSLYYISNLGVILTTDSLNVVKLPNTLIANADINIEVEKGFLECRSSWTNYSFQYKARGGEQYLHLGCFLTDEKLLYRTYQDRRSFCSKTGYSDAYYLIDDVALVKYKSSGKELSDVESIIMLEKKTPSKSFTFDDINFETGDFSSASSEFQQFEALLNYLKENPDLDVLIEGHTDDVGDAKDNLILSNERALFVKSYFQSQKITNKLYAKGYGEEIPVKPNDSKENRQANRRVVVKVF
jgi:outer membrane protein OmpA-like peptidoglycan-associated protein